MFNRSILSYGQMTYKASGVDITAGDNLVTRIKPLVARTKRSGMVGSIGGFGGLFDVAAAGYKDPLLVSGSDGVGTKLKVCGIDAQYPSSYFPSVTKYRKFLNPPNFSEIVLLHED